jgi:hypothetical protein
MKAGNLKMTSNGDAEQKGVMKKEFEYLISQEPIRERKLHENYLKQEFVRKIPKEVEDVIFRNLRKEK